MPDFDEIFRLRLTYSEATLWNLAKRDRRIAGKQLYEYPAFNNAVKIYLQAISSGLSDFDPEKLRHLEVACENFLLVIDQISSDLGRLTKKKLGPSLFDLVQHTHVILSNVRRLLHAADAELLEEPNAPARRPSPISTRIDEQRIVLDRGMDLHPLLREDALTETRRYLRQELAQISNALTSSNVDRKITNQFTKLTHLIDFDGDAGAIAFGLHVRGAAALAKIIENELSDVLTL